MGIGRKKLRYEYVPDFHETFLCRSAFRYEHPPIPTSTWCRYEPGSDRSAGLLFTEQRMAITHYRANSGFIITVVIFLVAMMGLGLYVNNQSAGAGRSMAQSPSQPTSTIRP
jgi:hypothetical protein